MASNWPEKYNYHPSPENPDDDQELDLLYKYSEFDYHSVNVDRAWSTVNAKINKERSFQINLFWRVAAILLITGGIAFTVHQFAEFAPEPALTEVRAQESSKLYTLPDGSMVTLARNSTLSFSKENFTENRSISFEGEGFFEIKKAHSTFTVHTSGAEVKVLGTSFNLETRDAGISLFVKTGLVAIETSKASRKVSPGQLASAGKNGDILVRKSADPNLLSWKTGVFVFDNVKLEEAIPYLEKYYDATFDVSPGLSSCTITAHFEGQTLEEVVDVLSTVLNAKGDVNDQEVNLNGAGC